MEPPLPDGMILSYPVYILDQQKQRDKRNLYHFAMRLRPEFETLRGNILHRSPLTNITDAVSEFIAEEIRLRILTPAHPSMTSTTALAASYISGTSAPRASAPSDSSRNNSKV